MSAASVFAAASSCMRRSTCEYMPSVDAALACPSCSQTTFGGVPTALTLTSSIVHNLGWQAGRGPEPLSKGPERPFFVSWHWLQQFPNASQLQGTLLLTSLNLL